MLCAAHMPRILQKVLDNGSCAFIGHIHEPLHLASDSLRADARGLVSGREHLAHHPRGTAGYSLLCFSVAILVAMAATYGLEQPAARAVNAWIKR